MQALMMSSMEVFNWVSLCVKAFGALMALQASVQVKSVVLHHAACMDTAPWDLLQRIRSHSYKCDKSHVERIKRILCCPSDDWLLNILLHQVHLS